MRRYDSVFRSFRHFFFPACLLCGLSLYGQVPFFEIESTTIDLGDVSEDDPVIVREVTFKNNGTVPLVIQSVHTSCGCVTARYGQEPVRPGGEETVTLRFNPKGYPGAVNRSVHIYTNLVQGEPTEVLTLTARVGRTRDPFYQFQYTMGNLRLKQRSVHFGTHRASDARVFRIEVANSGTIPLVVGFRDVPPYLECRMEPAVLEPGKRGDLVFTYKPGSTGYRGHIGDKLILTGILPAVSSDVSTIEITGTLSD